MQKYLFLYQEVITFEINMSCTWKVPVGSLIYGYTVEGDVLQSL